MNIIYRFQMIFGSSIGKLLLIFFFFLLFLLFLYLFLRLKMRAQDVLAYRYQEHYEKTNKILSAVSEYAGSHKVDFFGRQTLVLYKGNYGLCSAIPPDLFKRESCERFRYYERSICHRSLSAFSTYVWSYSDDLIIAIQEKILKKDGSPLPSLREYYLDKKLGFADVELILLEIARSLAMLHELKTDEGESLYYGVLLPRFIRLGFDGESRIDKVVLSDHGMAFSIGPEKVCEYLNFILNRKKRKIMDAYCEKEIIDEWMMFAPEQRDGKRVCEVGVSVDFYAFGALAVWMFTGEKIFDVEFVKWSSIPQKWHVFIKRCLDDAPGRRPKDFLELQDRLCDPNIALTHHGHEDFGEDLEIKEDVVPLGGLAAVLHEAKTLKKRRENLSQTNDSGEELFEDESFERLKRSGEYSLNSGRWSVSKKYFHQACAINAEHPIVNVSLAIIYYEEGDLQKAEEFYQKAKNLDESVAKRFREHIAFRV